MRNYQIHFIKHGFTAQNEQGIVIAQGTDSSLSENGAAKLRDLQEKFSYPKVDKIYTSPMKRCLETAGILYPENYTEVAEGLTDLNLGEFDNKHIDTLAQDDNYLNWVQDSKKYTPQGGESTEAFAKRCSEAFEQIIEKMVKEKTYNVAIVTHGSVLMQILSAFGLPKRPPYEWVIGYGKGVSALLNLQIWSNDKLVELAGIVPHGETQLK